MSRDRAAYMREYRAQKRALDVRVAVDSIDRSIAAYQRIAELEAEVRYLKAELAKRPAAVIPGGFNTRPFTPVPKKGTR